MDYFGNDEVALFFEKQAAKFNAKEIDNGSFQG